MDFSGRKWSQECLRRLFGLMAGVFDATTTTKTIAMSNDCGEQLAYAENDKANPFCLNTIHVDMLHSRRFMLRNTPPSLRSTQRNTKRQLNYGSEVAF